MMEEDIHSKTKVNTMRAKHYILNELIFFSVKDDALQARQQYLDLLENIEPDRQVRSYLKWDSKVPNGAILHSTSWRYDVVRQSLVLSWAIYPDPNPDQHTQPVDRYVPSFQVDAAHPAPREGEAVEAVAHAARHLSFLSKTDPSFRNALLKDPKLADALRKYAPSEVFTDNLD